MSFSLFFFHTPTTTDIYTLSLHDALPISDAFNRKFGNDYAQVATVARPSGKKPELRRTGEDGQFANSREDRKSTRLNSSHRCISYAVFCLKKKKENTEHHTQTNQQEKLRI